MEPVDPAAHRVHGLADDEVVPDWPPLQAEEVGAVLAGYPDCAGPVTIRWRSPRTFSAAARVACGAREVFVKRHHEHVRGPAGLAIEHAFMAHLRSRSVPIPDVLPDAAGRTVVQRGPWVYEVHALARGVDLYRDSPSWTPLTELGQARHAGRMLARLHAAAVGFSVPDAPRAVLAVRPDVLRAADFDAAVLAMAARRPALARYLAARDWRGEMAPIRVLHRAVQSRLMTEAVLWTHNDWHASNLFWSDAGPAARVRDVLDFGLAAQAFALYDLATAIERNAVAWLHLERGAAAAFPATAAALVEGYAEVLPLSVVQRRTLADLLPVVHLDYALAEVDYFLSVTHSPTHADVAWSAFLLGHAAWFATPPGHALLAAVRGRD